MSFRCKVFVITHWQNDVEAISRLADGVIPSWWATSSLDCNDAPTRTHVRAFMRTIILLYKQKLLSEPMYYL